MNHLTRLGDYEDEYAHSVLRRGKRPIFRPTQYLLQRIKDTGEEIKAKEELIKKLVEDIRIPPRFYQHYKNKLNTQSV